MNNKKGFTLLELIIVVVIIGALAAISIPQFYSYKARGYDAVATNVLKSAAIAQEGYFTDNQEYTLVEEDLMQYGHQSDPGVNFVILAANKNRYMMEASHNDSSNTYGTTSGTVVLKQ